MKLAMFTTKESYAKALIRQADAIEKNGLAQAKQNLEKALAGVGKAEYLKLNNISTEYADIAWRNQVAWLQGSVASLERKVKKYRRDAQKALA